MKKLIALALLAISTPAISRADTYEKAGKNSVRVVTENVQEYDVAYLKQLIAEEEAKSQERTAEYQKLIDEAKKVGVEA